VSWENVWEKYRAGIPLMIRRIPLYAQAIIDAEGRLLTREEEKAVERAVL
jgi:hypothetical protein